MQKFTIENAGATLRGPVDLRLFDMAVQQRNAPILGGRWPAGGAFALDEGQAIVFEPGDVVAVSDPASLADGAPAKPAPRRGRDKSDEAETD